MRQHDEHCGCGNHPQGSDQPNPQQAHKGSCGCGNHDQRCEPAEHPHTHDEHCGCGQPHPNEPSDQPHVHGQHCGCGQPHSNEPSGQPHVHGAHCGCGQSHAPIPAPEGLSPLQIDFLMALRQRQYLPVACFSLAKSDDDDRHSIALAPVYLSAPEDSMEQVKRLGHDLKLMESLDLLTLDYDLPLRNYQYDEYKTSALYAYFVKTVQEAAVRPNATFDTPVLELGSMALTDAGEEMVDQLLSKA